VDAEGGRACTSVAADADAPPLIVRFTPRAHPDADVQEEGETLEAVLEPGGSVRFTSENKGGVWETRLAGADDDSACAGELP
jgi:hypothetical protein